jgi:fatty-acyl-CoA synthase
VTGSCNADSLLAAGARGARPALTFSGRTFSYGDLESAADRLVERLDRLAPSAGGTQTLTGARVAIVAPNAPALVVGLRGAWRAGAVCVPLSARLREYELRGVLRNAEPAAIVSIASHRGYRFRDLLPELLRDLPSVRGCVFVDTAGEVEETILPAGGAAGWEPLEAEIAAILYTSGSTGAPKGALTTHESLAAEARELARRLGMTPNDKTVLVIPGTHAFGLACLLAALASGGTSALVDSTLSLEPLIAELGDPPAGLLHGSPALFAGLLKQRAGPWRGLRGFVAGAPCPPDVLERLEASGASVLNLFGMTETGAACSCAPDDPPEARRTTVGRAFPGFSFRTVKAGGADEPVEELQVRGPYVTPGYFRQPTLTDEAFDDDWLRTGDLGSIEESGHIRISGRLKELIQVAGFNVLPAEVEGCLLGHPDVEQAVVVGVSHERMGEAPAAFVVVRDRSALREPDLIRFVRGRIAGYKVPYSIEILPELPLLASGKPDRPALRERIAARSQPAHA